MDRISPGIKTYIETEILPKYMELKGHTGKHIEQVIERSLEFAKQAPGVNLDMVYVIAAYHDLGRLVDNETHNFISAEMLKTDKNLKKWFTKDEIKTMAEAVEDHRSTLGHEPRSVYGRIVSSADRNPDIASMLERCYDYTKLLNPEMDEDELIEQVRIHLREKYAPDGYAASTMYFKNDSFEKLLAEVGEMTETPEGFNKIQKEFNLKRFGESGFEKAVELDV